jgi:hypothetical protein
MRSSVKTGTTMNNILIVGDSLFCGATEISIVSNELMPHLFHQRSKHARGDLDCWNMISPILLAQQSMEKTNAFVRFL